MVIKTCEDGSEVTPGMLAAAVVVGAIGAAAITSAFTLRDNLFDRKHRAKTPKE